MKNFMTLVNDAISEAKVTLDPLTSVNFANPPRTILYNKFKTWVNMAYKELLMERNEWYFQKERVSTTVGPRIHVLSGAYVPQVGDVIRGQYSQFEVTVLSVETFEDDELSTGTMEYTMDIALPEGKRIADFAYPEPIDVISPTPEVGAMLYQGPGFFQGKVPQFRVDKWKVTIFDPLSEIAVPGSNTQSAWPLVPVPWDAWAAYAFPWTNTGSKPYFVTQNPQGYFAIYPLPEKVYPIEIYYTRGPSEMVEWDDEPDGFPELYEDYILWKAVEEFADYDSNTRLFSRANKKVEKYRYWLERDEMPDVVIGRSKFDRNDWYNR